MMKLSDQAQHLGRTRADEERDKNYRRVREDEPMRNARIIGAGFYVPPKIVTNDDLAKLMDTSDEWIVERTGIKERHYIEDGVGSSDLALEASRKALKSAGLKPEDLDLIVLATLSPDYYFPGSGVMVQHKLGCRDIAAIDVRAQCSGFIYALSIADQFIKTGKYERVLVIGTEVQSCGLDFTTNGRDMSVLFGDGAGAVVLSACDEDRGILSTHLHSHGENFDKLWTYAPAACRVPRITKEMLDSGLQYPKMDGKFIFRLAIDKFCEVINEALSANNYKLEDLDLFIPHQANLRISLMVGRKLGLPEEKLFNNIQKYGNTTAATIPIAITEALEQGKIKDGSLVCLASFGSGLTWASALIRW
jgi:3-oxoacyl-[acyl-carrier-protein] synthase III